MTRRPACTSPRTASSSPRAPGGVPPRRAPPRRAQSVADLGCGIGGDLIAFARAGLVAAGVDLVPVRVAVARANLEALGLPGAVQVADATARPLALRRRVRRPRQALGERTHVRRRRLHAAVVLRGVADGAAACAKVAPGVPHDRVPPARGRVGQRPRRGQGGRPVVPMLATTARRATVIGPTGWRPSPPRTTPGGPGRAGGPFLAEPDGAVVRAGLVTAVAADVDGWLLDEHIAYVSSADWPRRRSPVRTRSSRSCPSGGAAARRPPRARHRCADHQEARRRRRRPSSCVSRLDLHGEDEARRSC